MMSNAVVVMVSLAAGTLRVKGFRSNVVGK